MHVDDDYPFADLDIVRARLRTIEAEACDAITDADALRRMMLADMKAGDNLETYREACRMLERRAVCVEAKLQHEQEYLTLAWHRWRSARTWLMDVALVIAQIWTRR